MPVSHIQLHCHPVPVQSLPAERRALLRFSLLSALAHMVALAILVVWGGGSTRFQPPLQVITVDLSQVKPLQPQALPRLVDSRPPKPTQRLAAPVPARPVKAVKPLPVTNAAKPRPVAVPGRTVAVAAPAGSSREPVRWGIPATPSGASSEIPSGALSGSPSGRPPGTAVSASEGAAGTTATSRPATAPSSTASRGGGQTVEKGGVRAGYIRKCRALIERHKEYPVMARRGMIEGTVVISGKLARDGDLRQCSIIKGSGSGLLDNAAMRAVRGVGRFPPLPAEILGDELVFELPVTFKLSSD